MTIANLPTKRCIWLAVWPHARSGDGHYQGCLLRNEFRGAHYKPEFPDRDDENWLKTTIATYDSSKDEPVITYEPVDIRHLKPIQRDYSHAHKR